MKRFLMISALSALVIVAACDRGSGTGATNTDNLSNSQSDTALADAKNKYADECTNFAPNPTSQADIAIVINCNNLDLQITQNSDEARQKFAAKCANLPVFNPDSYSQMDLINLSYCNNLDVMSIQSADEAKQKYTEKCSNVTTANTTQLDMINQFYCSNLKAKM